jgi:NADH dehydrogenase FAD-containing subunit
MQVPYDRLLKHGRIVFGKALNVHPERNTVEVAVGADGREIQQIPYDFLVIATGSSYDIPSAAFSRKSVESEAKLQELYAAVQAADAITVVGGGPVGCEVAGELKQDYPHKTVTLVHSGPTLISAGHNGNLPDTFRARVLSNLQQLGVDVRFNQRVANVDGQLPAGVHRITPRVIAGNTKLTVTSSPGVPSQAVSTISSDLTLFVTGSSPNNEALGNLRSVFDASGRVKVEDTLQVVNHPNIFAIGDIAGNPDPKTAAAIKMLQTPVLVKNIKALAAAKNDQVDPSIVKLARRKYGGAGMMLVTTGRKGGVGVMPNGMLLGNWAAAKLKGKDLMTARTNADLNWNIADTKPRVERNDAVMSKLASQKSSSISAEHHVVNTRTAAY